MLRPRERHVTTGVLQQSRADGTLAGDSVVGSIHQVGAKLGVLRVVMVGLIVSNGMVRVLIDQLRKQIRDEVVAV